MPDNICSALARRRATARTTRQSLPKFGKDARNGPRDLLQLPEYIAGIGWHGACTMMRRGRFLEEDEIGHGERRSEEHTSELQSLMRISYAVFCLKEKKSTTI